MLTFVFLSYLFVVFFIGFIAWKKTVSASDYVLGGRRLGATSAALSAGASDMSGWLLLGLPGFAYLAGLEALWIALGLFLGTVLNWVFVAKKIRIQSEHLGDSLTIPSYLANRFADYSVSLRIISAVFILIFFTFYTASGLVAGAKLFEAVFEYSYHTALVLGLLVITVYTVFGGFLAVSWTDVLQGLLMLLALVVVAVMLLANQQEGVQISANLFNPFTSKDGTALGAIAIISSMAWGLGYFGQPHILARFKAINSVALVSRARIIAIAWTGMSLLAACLIGLYANGFFAAPLADSEKVFLQLIEVLFHPVVAGILLSAILAAIMSTADSQLLVSASVLIEDIYKGALNKQPSDMQSLWIGRLAVLLVALIALLIAQDQSSKVLELVGYAWAGFGAAFGPVILFSLYSDKITGFAALSGIVVGGVTVMVWGNLEGGVFEIYELLPAFLASSLTIVALSFSRWQTR